MSRVSLYACVLSTIVVPLAVAQASTPTSSSSPSPSPVSNPCPCPKAFQGLFFGGNIGYGEGGGKQNRTLVGITASSNNNLRLNGVDGGVNVGYTHRFGNVGVGLEFVANWASAQGKGVNSTLGLTATSTERLKNSLQLRANFSYVICDLVSPKLILGWDNSQWQNSIQATIAGPDLNFTQTLQKRYNGFLWGAGVDFLVLKNLIAGVEYTSTRSGTHNFSAVAPGIGITAQSSFKPSYQKVALVVKYIFW